MWNLALPNLGVGIILMGISIPMIYRKIGPNHFYGFRVRQTLEDPEIWYDVNEYSGKLLFGSGIIIVLTSIGLSMVPNLDVSIYKLITETIDFLLVITALILSINYMNSL